VPDMRGKLPEDGGVIAHGDVRLDEQCEVLSAIGDIATGDEGKPSLHVHVVRAIRRHDARQPSARGKVRPTLEVVLEETPTGLRRCKRPEFGIALIDLADVAKT
jgi:uncharacterized protein